MAEASEDFTDTQTVNVAVMRDLTRFSLWYFGLLFGIRFLFGFVEALTGFEVVFGVVPLACLFGAAAFTTEAFLKKHRRPPDPKEKRRLVYGSLAASWLIMLLIAVLAVLVVGEALRIQLMIALMQVRLQPIASAMSILLMVGFAFVVYLLVLKWSYGGLARKRLGKLKAKGKLSTSNP